MSDNDMYRRAYFDVQKVLDKALGPNEEDGAGEGIAADVQLLADHLSAARAEAARLASLLDADGSQRTYFAVCPTTQVEFRIALSDMAPPKTLADLPPALTEADGIAPSCLCGERHTLIEITPAAAAWLAERDDDEDGPREPGGCPACGFVHDDDEPHMVEAL